MPCGHAWAIHYSLSITVQDQLLGLSDSRTSIVVFTPRKCKLYAPHLYTI
jgi:hypothetical protein